MDVSEIETNLVLETKVANHVPMEGLPFGSKLKGDGYELTSTSATNANWNVYSKAITEHTVAQVEVRPGEAERPGTLFHVRLETLCLDRVEHAPLREWKEMLVSIVESLERLGQPTMSARPTYDVG